MLSYLITAYGENDDEILAHRLLGIAMGVLNDRPVLSRSLIASALPPPGSDLQNQVERVRITPDPRPQDEISRMWTTFNTGYRLSVGYRRSGSPDRQHAARRRGPAGADAGRGDTGPVAVASLYPQLQLAVPPNRQPAAQPGDVLTLTGSQLTAVTAGPGEPPAGRAAGDARTAQPHGVRADGAAPRSLPSCPPASRPSRRRSTPAGPGQAGAVTLSSNAVPVALAPQLVSSAPLSVKLVQGGPTPLTVTCSPAVQPQQTIALIVGSRLVLAEPVPAATSQLSFSLQGFTPGRYLLRVRIDQTDSIPVAGLAAPSNPDQPTPMQYNPNQYLVLTT